MKAWHDPRYLLGIVLAVILGVTACGGGGGGDSGDTSGPSTTTGTTATGFFKDSNVSGLSYVSGGQSGVTGPDGSFTYEVGQTITFFIGGVIIGSVTISDSDGLVIITPIDLVTNGSSSSIIVQNIVRFLLMLDVDGDPTNGITISVGVQNIADTWSQVDFSSTDLQAELTDIISDAASVDGGIHTLPDAATAEDHVESTWLCTVAGGYRGTYDGGDTGRFGIIVDALTGHVTGFAISDIDQVPITINGNVAITSDPNSEFISGSTSTGATYRGRFPSPNAVSGTWQDDTPSLSGDFNGERVGGALEAVYRFTGVYTGTDVGFYTFDVEVSDTITGVAYSVLSNQEFTLSGTVTGGIVSGTVSSGATFTGVLDKIARTVGGTWEGPDQSDFGTYLGTGCKWN